MITLIASNQTKLTEKGFDLTTRLGELQTSSEAASAAEVSQQEAKAALKAATANSVSQLSDAYKMASDFADLISGLFGKNDEIVQEIRKYSLSNNSSATANIYAAIKNKGYAVVFGITFSKVRNFGKG